MVGASVEAKMTLFEVADLSTVWVEADVYEKDIPFLQPGQKVEATVEAYPNRTFTGKLALDLSAAGRRHAHQPRPLRAGQSAARTAARHVRHGADQHAPGDHRALQDRGDEARQVMLVASGGKGDSPHFRDHPPVGARPEGASQKWGLSPFPARPRRRPASSSSCRSGPWSIPARRRWSMSSASRDCSRAWRSSLDRARANSIRSSRVSTPATRWRRRAAS